MSLSFDIKKMTGAVIGDTIVASVATIGALMLASRIECETPWAALNPTCHMIDGDSKRYGDDFNSRDTPIAIALIVSAMAGWSVLYRCFSPKVKLPKSILTASLMTGFAYLVDYYIVPKRFTPGFEARLSPKAIFFVYSALAIAFAARPPISETPR